MDDQDVRYTVPFLGQFSLVAFPVAYPSSLVPEAWRPLYGLNPMDGVLEGSRCALLGTASRQARWSLSRRSHVLAAHGAYLRSAIRSLERGA